MYENIYFLFQKNTQTKKFPLANLFVQIYVFSLQKVKDRPLCFSAKKSAVRVVFKCKLYLKNSMKLIKKFFFLRPPGWKFFSSPAFPETRVLLLLFFWPCLAMFCFSVCKWGSAREEYQKRLKSAPPCWQIWNILNSVFLILIKIFLILIINSFSYFYLFSLALNPCPTLFIDR